MRIVNTDNFSSACPDESFVDLPSLDKELAAKVCKRINACWSGAFAPRYWKVVEDTYKLVPGFKP